MYAEYLEYLGMQIETAYDGLAGIQKAKSFGPDAIVMDISMPIMEGNVAAERLKEDAGTRHIPIVALTAFGGLARNKARLAPFDCFHTKPCLPRDLARIVLDLLPGSPAAGKGRRTRRSRPPLAS
jgi:CheY-like chemotaxis protein